MKNITKLLIAVLASASVVSCTNFLGKNSISTVDNIFVFNSYETAKTVIYGAYNSVLNSYNSGAPTNFDNIGSDVERCSVGMIANLVGAANLYGGQSSYTPETININDGAFNYWNTWYSAISKCNQVILNIQAMPNYEELITKNVPNDWSDLLGQAYAMRATMYRELTWHYGDCIYYSEAEVGMDIKELTCRDQVLDKEIEALIKIEPLMYKVGDNGHMPDQMTRNYVDGLIGRLCFQEAGYQTRRTDLGDDFYVKEDGSKYSIDVWGTDPARNAAYGRRTDWKDLYAKALPWLKKGVTETGEVKLTTVDPRTDAKRVYGNPFQYYFEQVTQLVMPYESVFEFTMRNETSFSRIAYNFGRGSNGGSPAYPPKSNAQTCSFPAVFYGYFDPQDLRRDATLGVTGSSGTGQEQLYNYSLSNKNTLGIGMNKYDLNRQENPDNRQLFCGINYIMMRQAEIILMYAEALAVTGNDSEAKTYLKQIHDRAFPAAVRDAKFSAFLADAGDTYAAVINERCLEFMDEDLRRWDLIRTGLLPNVAVDFRAELVKEIAEMKKNGVVKFDNGNEFPAFVWTKTVDAKKLLGYRLTAQTPAGLDPMSDEYAITFPGYRGQHDNWLAVAEEDGRATSISYGNGKNDETNLAILGLTKQLTAAQIADAEARGYKKTPWGVLMYQKADGTPDAVTEGRWGSEFMCGYSDADFAAKKAPIYLLPMNETTCTTTGLQNGYGFRSSTK